MTTKDKFFRKILLITFSVIVLLLIGFILIQRYLFWRLQKQLEQSSPDSLQYQKFTHELQKEQQSRKVYSFSSYTFEYPSSWYITECEEGSKLLLDPETKRACDNNERSPLIIHRDLNWKTEIEYINHLQSLGFEAIWLSTHPPRNAKKYEIRELTVDHGGYGYTFREIVFSHNEILYMITINDSEQEKVADEILSTFKFVQ